jgi:hypothetical protein
MISPKDAGAELLSNPYKSPPIALKLVFKIPTMSTGSPKKLSTSSVLTSGAGPGAGPGVGDERIYVLDVDIDQYDSFLGSYALRQLLATATIRSRIFFWSKRAIEHPNPSTTSSSMSISMFYMHIQQHITHPSIFGNKRALISVYSPQALKKWFPWSYASKRLARMHRVIVNLRFIPSTRQLRALWSFIDPECVVTRVV